MRANITLVLTGEALVWEARIALPGPGTLRYKYIVTDENQGVVEEEPQPRAVDIFQDMVEGGAVHLHDTWQVQTSSECFLWTGDCGAGSVALQDDTSRSTT